MRETENLSINSLISRRISVSGEENKDLFGRRLSPLEPIERKPILPSEEEIASNTRARSAKLRIARKI